MNGCVKITLVPEYRQYEYTYSETECGEKSPVEE